MSTESIISPARAQDEDHYFTALKEKRHIAGVIATELEPLLESKGATALANCGRYGIGADPIELVEGERGLFVRGAKWCGSRYCPHCQPRVMGVLQTKRAARARAAQAAGFGIPFLRVSQPRGAAGELAPLLDTQREQWCVAYPSPSRLPADFQRSVPDWIGVDWNIEIDWDAEAQTWHVHTHALPWLLGRCSPEKLSYLLERWPRNGSDGGYIEEAHSPEAAARYSVKEENNDPGLLNLFGLAAAGMTEHVSEYLYAVQGRRLRDTSRKLTDVLRLGGKGEEDKALMAQAEAAAATMPGKILHRFTPREWCALW